MKKILIIIFAVLIVGLAIFIRFMPSKNIPAFIKGNETVSKVLCIYPVKIQGSSMEPVMSEGKRVNFNKCFDAGKLKVDDVIMFDDRGKKRLSIIREIMEEGGVVIYKTSQEARKDEIIEVRPEQIIGIY